MNPTPKERPILFSAPMVRAILDGRKTQTRRVVKGIPDGVEMVKYYGAYTDGRYPNSAPRKALEYSLGWFVPEAGDLWPCNDKDRIKCPYGISGDRLWVRETFLQDSNGFIYRADGDFEGNAKILGGWRPSIFMPRWASRILLEITNVRVERLQDINEEDAIAEGVEPNWIGPLDQGNNGLGSQGWLGDEWIYYGRSWDDAPAYSATESYQSLWESINGQGSLDLNPFVWVLEFRRINHGTN